MSLRRYSRMHGTAHQRKVLDRVMRDRLLARRLPVLFSDIGTEPLTEAQAYDLGCEPRQVQRRRGRRGWEWMPVDPALPAHCLRPYDMGHEFSRVVMPELEDDDDWYGYDDYDSGYGFDPSYWAYHDRHCTLEDDEVR